MTMMTPDVSPRPDRFGLSDVVAISILVPWYWWHWLVVKFMEIGEAILKPLFAPFVRKECPTS